MINSIIHYKKDEDTMKIHVAVIAEKKCITRGVGNYVFFFNDRYLHTSQDSSQSN